MAIGAVLLARSASSTILITLILTRHDNYRIWRFCRQSHAELGRSMAELAPNYSSILFVLFLLPLELEVWSGWPLLGVALVRDGAVHAATGRRPMMTIISAFASSWSLTGLPLFIWMGEILFRTRLSGGYVSRVVARMARLRWAAAYQLSSAAPFLRLFSAFFCRDAAPPVGEESIPQLPQAQTTRTHLVIERWPCAA